ncbi:hypothetical protein PBY51_005877 [Eleginops maclovinus]|uniref:C-type lectin domain-containing protein n=1 Tax=Eleginops maclovinus TaxID=56733 RepID=A0AAN7ZUU7_ELEMC|nr:hypothetical protein PBY51_005877 [Eleginops maclovinus]
MRMRFTSTSQLSEDDINKLLLEQFRNLLIERGLPTNIRVGLKKSPRINNFLDDGANLALGGVAVSSTVWNYHHRPSNANDGRDETNQYYHHSCFSTLQQTDPWWRLDLGGLYDISTIELIRRTDCCSNQLDAAEIRIGNSLENNGNNSTRCAVVPVNSIVKMTFHCNQKNVRFVNLFRPGIRSQLQVCEVKVFAATPITGEIRIGNSLENNGNNNPRCAVITVTSNATITFNCIHMQGRYVNVILPGVNKYLSLCEVKVYATTQLTGANVAPRGIPTLSSAPASVESTPNMAIDVFPGPWYAYETCASVALQDNPWWQLDLRSIYRITAVSILSAGDCCSGQLNGAEVRIGLSKDVSNQRCAIISVSEGQQEYNYQCGIMEGRFVHVYLPGLQKTLTVCEVKVYGTVLENVALRGMAFHSSSSLEPSEASKVIDGNQFSTCSIGNEQPGPWVTVDLVVPYSVTAIQLTYSAGCCYSYDVRVDDASCEVIPSNSYSLVTLDCGGIVGRYVTVIHHGIAPPLCEVEVYSTLENLQNRFPQLPPPSDYCYDASCGRDYILVHNEPKTWFEAQTFCREKYTDLATINNVQDMSRVVEQMGNYSNDLWIGLYEDVVTWRWSLSDETYYGASEAEFRNWGAGEPNLESVTQDCAGIQHTGEWKDLQCDLLNFFLCFDGRAGAHQSKVLVETAMNWAEARSYCWKHHTDLLSVRNQAENQEIQSMLPEGKLAWIGLFQDSWKWSDGSYSSFRYLSRQQPLLGEGPNCAHVYDRKWNVRSCDTKSMFLCYKFKKRTFVRINADIDMSDPLIQQQILSQLEAKMKNKGLIEFKTSWKMTGKPQQPPI